MAIIKSFCVVFTIRLGSIIIGIAYFMETLICTIVAAIWVGADPSKTAEALDDLLAEKKLLYFSDLLHRISRDPSPFKELALCVCCMRLVGCLLEIYGTFYMKPLYLLPFLTVELVRLCLFLFLHVSAMQLLKENSQDLGLLIGATLVGSFVLLFMFYTWFCVYSLFQALWWLRSRSMKKNVSQQQLVDAEEFPPKLYPAYSTVAPVY